MGAVHMDFLQFLHYHLNGPYLIWEISPCRQPWWQLLCSLESPPPSSVAEFSEPPGIICAIISQLFAQVFAQLLASNRFEQHGLYLDMFGFADRTLTGCLKCYQGMVGGAAELKVV